jgi:hypothetical protein
MQVGKVYSFLDKEKFKLFLHYSTPIALFCVSSTGGEQVFFVVRADRQWSPIAPVLPMYWDGDAFQLVDYARLDRQGRLDDYLDTEASVFENAYIPNTNTPYFTAGDYIKVKKMTSGVWTEKTIATATSKEITVTDTTSLTTGFWLVRYTDSANRNAKQVKFLDIEGGTYV